MRFSFCRKSVAEQSRVEEVKSVSQVEDITSPAALQRTENSAAAERERLRKREQERRRREAVSILKFSPQNVRWFEKFEEP